jgi:hypothetical protein
LLGIKFERSESTGICKEVHSKLCSLIWEAWLQGSR